MSEQSGLRAICQAGGRVDPLGVEGEGWRLSIPGGPGGVYRLAQLDDYAGQARRQFAWRAPVDLSVRMRASAANLPGTWGFGLWNDPFSMGVLAGQGRRLGSLRLPAAPNTAWFFFASPENYLALGRHAPGHGAMAAVFRSPPCPSAWMIAGAPAAPLLLSRAGVRLLRWVGRAVLGQVGAALHHDPTGWHTYRIQIGAGSRFWVDDALALDTPVQPRGPLGLVIWIDNQFMALPPSGKAAYGWLETCEAWVEVQWVKKH